MVKDLISIIIPVYNAEKYIDKCWEYILNQTYTNWEAIFVDDGSSDNTSYKCKKIAEHTSSVLYFYKNNGGPASARNIGIKHASGEYLYFLDVDDNLHRDALSELFSVYKEKNPEFVIGNSIRHQMNGEKKIEWVGNDVFCPNRESIKTLVYEFANDLKSNKIFWSAWGKLYKARIIEENNILFKEDIKSWEDTLFVFEYLKCCNTCYLTSKCLYTYNRYEQENIASSKYYLGAMDYKYTARVVNDILWDDEYKKVNNNFYSECAIFSIFNVIRLMPRNEKHYWKELYGVVSGIVNDLKVQSSIKDYVQKHDDNSTLIPLLIRMKMSLLIIIIFKKQLKK